MGTAHRSSWENIVNADTTPICPLPNIGPCVGETCNFWDPEEGCTGAGIAFAADPSLDQITNPGSENLE